MAIIYTNPHQQSLAAVQQELQQRIHQRDWIVKRIEELEAAIQHLTPLAQESFETGADMSLPQLCLRVLSFSPTIALPAPKIREGLAMMGIQVSGNNPLAVLHTSLGRLAQRGYVIQRGDGFQITRSGKEYLQQVL